jgi:hypothetical protein
MTKVQNPIIGRSSGQAGGVVFSKMYDKNVMRAKPFEVRDAQSPAQILNREVCAITTAYAKSFAKDSLLDLYPVSPIARSRYAEFLSEIQQGRDVSGANGTVDIDSISSFGNGNIPVFGVITQYIENGSLLLDWSGSDITVMSEPDSISVLLFDPNQLKSVLVHSVDDFAAMSAEIILADYGLSASGVIAYIGAYCAKFKGGAYLSLMVK